MSLIKTWNFFTTDIAHGLLAMKIYKKTVLSVCIALSSASFAVASKGPTLSLNPNSSHTLQFPSEVSQVLSSSTAVSVDTRSNTLIINGASAGSSELEIMLVGESTPRFITINVGQPRSSAAASPSPSVTSQPQQLTQTPVINTQPVATVPEPVVVAPAVEVMDEVVIAEPTVDTTPIMTQSDWSDANDTLTDAEIEQTVIADPLPSNEDALPRPTPFDPTNFDPNNLNNPEMFVAFDEAILRAFAYNPSVTSSWHAFAASANDIDFASAGWRPVVDFNASYAFESREWDNYDGNDNFSGAAAGITLTQSLYDGLRTSSEVRRFEAAQLVRYYELLNQVEATTLEALAAFLDVHRHRELVSLAEQNLQRHLEVFNQIERSAAAGVARRADLEQISGRLSLAETNLITEEANLHDVSARYLRIFGELPAYNLLPIELDTSFLPNNIRTALIEAYQSNPAFHAAIRNIEVQEAVVDANRSEFRPRVNLAARLNSRENDDQGFDNRRNDGQIAIEFSYNIFNGGRDSASLQRSLEEVNLAKSERDNACSNLRQNLQIALNDTTRIDSQLPRLNQHMMSSDSVRLAFKNQFDIGQRTLLDVLDSENEYFQAAIAYTNATFDRDIAAARALNEMGSLLTTLNIVKSGLPTLADLGASTFQVDPNSACPDVDVNNSIIRSRLL